MNFHLSPDLQALQLKVRKFVTEELIPLEAETEMNEGRLSPEVRARLMRQVRELGLNAMALPPRVGGRGFSWVAQTAVNEEAGKATNALGWIIFDPALALAAATPEQIEKYVRPACEGTLQDCYAITEAGAGSDASKMATTAMMAGF